MNLNIATILTISRIAFIPLIAFFYIFEDGIFRNISAYIFLIALITDYLDGYIARNFNQSTAFGAFLDPVADKILIVFLFFGLALNLSNYLVGFLGSIIITREIWVSALRDFNSRNNNTKATKVIYLAKIKTSIQLFTIFTYLSGLAFDLMILIIEGAFTLIWRNKQSALSKSRRLRAPASCCHQSECSESILQ